MTDEYRLPAVAQEDLEQARSAWAQRLLTVRWADALSWSWMGRVTGRLAELERRVERAVWEGRTSDAVGHAGDLAAHYRQSARVGVTGGSPFGKPAQGGEVVELATVRHERSDTTITVNGYPPDDGGPKPGRIA